MYTWYKEKIAFLQELKDIYQEQREIKKELKENKSKIMEIGKTSLENKDKDVDFEIKSNGECKEEKIEDEEEKWKKQGRQTLYVGEIYSFTRRPEHKTFKGEST